MRKTSNRAHRRGPGERRTQAERRASTRARVMEGTIDLIRRNGIASVTVANVVKHTGVSWGAMQNLFGTKEYLLVAICEHAIREMTGKLASLDCPSGSSVVQRVRAIVDRMREIFETPAFAAAAEIFRNPPRDKAARRTLHIALREGRSNMDRTWRHLFEDTRVNDGKLVFARHMVTMALSGLRAPQGVNDPISYEWQIPYDSFAERAIDFLVGNLAELLEPAAGARAQNCVRNAKPKRRGSFTKDGASAAANTRK